ncbi:hypothetical protein NC652_032873 [Populus alba x Populus x berolinensis]|nr:hypothetical protein NC652_032871 [Populus alba x Populus x berolinensis]KAJ6879419.1 hypothetical protein NC652_032873 [Populus alba x Populus x berolinensis]
MKRKGRKEVKWDFKKGDKMFKDWKKNETKSGDFEENDSDDEEEDKKKKKKVEEESEEQDDEHDGDGDESQLVICAAMAATAGCLGSPLSSTFLSYLALLSLSQLPHFAL